MLTVDITKQLPDFTLDIAFTLANHSLVLFGPSGCGKTTSLRCIAGLTAPDSGTIAYGDTLLFSHAKKSFLPPCKRRVGFMFQDYALFPHLNVKQNILYGAKKKETGDALSELLTTLKIPHLLHRSIPQLSGGEKQRVALARALMAEPNILLLDEPLSALDHETRLEVQTELKRLQKTWSIPFILVTHDRKEAEAMGDEILFLDKGHIVEHKKLNSAN